MLDGERSGGFFSLAALLPLGDSTLWYPERGTDTKGMLWAPRRALRIGTSWVLVATTVKLLPGPNQSARQSVRSTCCRVIE